MAAGKGGGGKQEPKNGLLWVEVFAKSYLALYDHFFQAVAYTRAWRNPAVSPERSVVTHHTAL
jgi:hypothetical protein